MSRALSPHAFAHDGARWHVRAYCHQRESFRDFVIARILEIEGDVPPGKGASEDEAWNTTVKLVLAPHPKLPAGHRRAIELDYGMVNGRVVLECREASCSTCSATCGSTIAARARAGAADRAQECA